MPPEKQTPLDQGSSENMSSKEFIESKKKILEESVSLRLALINFTKDHHNKYSSYIELVVEFCKQPVFINSYTCKLLALECKSGDDLEIACSQRMYQATMGFLSIFKLFATNAHNLQFICSYYLSSAGVPHETVTFPIFSAPAQEKHTGEVGEILQLYQLGIDWMFQNYHKYNSIYELYAGFINSDEYKELGDEEIFGWEVYIQKAIGMNLEQYLEDLELILNFIEFQVSLGEQCIADSKQIIKLMKLLTKAANKDAFIGNIPQTTDALGYENVFSTSSSNSSTAMEYETAFNPSSSNSSVLHQPEVTIEQGVVAEMARGMHNQEQSKEKARQ